MFGAPLLAEPWRTRSNRAIRRGPSSRGGGKKVGGGNARACSGPELVLHFDQEHFFFFFLPVVGKKKMFSHSAWLLLAGQYFVADGSLDLNSPRSVLLSVTLLFKLVCLKCFRNNLQAGRRFLLSLSGLSQVFSRFKISKPKDTVHGGWGAESASSAEHTTVPQFL